MAKGIIVATGHVVHPVEERPGGMVALHCPHFGRGEHLLDSNSERYPIVVVEEPFDLKRCKSCYDPELADG